MSVKKITVATILLFNLIACHSGGSRNHINKSTYELNAKTAELNQINEKVNQLSQQLETTNAEKAILENDLKNKSDVLGNTQLNLDNSNRDLNAKTAELNQINEKVNQLSQQLDNAKEGKEKAEKALKDKNNVVNEINEKLFATLENASNDGYDLAEQIGIQRLLVDGMNKIPFLVITKDREDGIFVGDRYIYKQNYSGLWTKTVTATSTEDSFRDPNFRSFRIDRIEDYSNGQTTIPQSGSATYIGKAFNADNLGDLIYHVNFDERTGQGKLTGFKNIADIYLETGKINQSNNINANATMLDGTQGKYQVGFYGPEAKEIAGEAYMFKHLDNTVRSNSYSRDKWGSEVRGTAFGLAGKRDDLQP